MMDLDGLARAVAEVVGPANVRRGAPLAAYTVWRIGGPADVLAVVATAEALRRAVVLAWEAGVPCWVLGGGSNVLIADAGVRGLVVLNRARASRVAGQAAWAESGATFSALARDCARRGLRGLEWATGIPGTVGGAVWGNAGAWGGEVASVLARATILAPGGTVSEWPAGRLGYGYRTSVLKRDAAAAGGAPRPVILAAEFALQPDDPATLRARIAELSARRRAGQPAGASCGSVFKNPPGDYAGRLIEAAGLKGKQIGGAQISPVHANFIVNVGGASAGDVRALIQVARDTVYDRFATGLELEIELAGEWHKD